MRLAITVCALVLATSSVAKADHCRSALGPVLQSAQLSDGTFVKRYQSAIVLGERRLDTCNELPDPYPTAMAVYGDQVFVGFREKGALRFDDDKFVALMKPALPVRSMAVASDMLWIGTPHGLWTFEKDGSAERAKHRRLKKAAISELMVDGSGHLHIARTPRGWWTHDGSAFKKKNNKTVGCFASSKTGTISIKDRSRCGRSTEALHATSLGQVGTSLFAGTLSDGLFVRKGSRWKKLPKSPRFINVLLPDGDALLIGGPHGVWKRDRAGVFTKLKISRRSVHVNGLHRDAKGTLWVAASDALYAIKGGKVRRFDQRNSLPGRIVFAVTSTSDGATWAATSQGVVRLHEDGNTVFSHELGTLPDNWVTSLLPDGDNVIAGTYDAGVVTLQKTGTHTRIKKLKKLWVNPNGLRRVDGALYISTLGDGLVRYDAGKIKHQQHLPSDDVTAVHKRGTRLWVATRSGIVSYN